MRVPVLALVCAGAGTYFANQSCKAAQYAKDKGGVKTLIVARVTLGDPYCALA